MIEAVEQGDIEHYERYGSALHEDHAYIEGLFYSQIESLTRGCRR